MTPSAGLPWRVRLIGWLGVTAYQGDGLARSMPRRRVDGKPATRSHAASPMWAKTGRQRLHGADLKNLAEPESRRQPLTARPSWGWLEPSVT